MAFSVVTGDIWNLDLSHYIVVPVNNGGVMGRGIAYQAFQKYPSQCSEDIRYRRMIGRGAKTVRTDSPLIFFPVKTVWHDNASLAIIEQSCKELLGAFRAISPVQIAMPEVGTGYGKLSWTDVLPVLERELAPIAQYVTLVLPEPGLAAKYPRSFRPAAKPYWIKQAAE